MKFRHLIFLTSLFLSTCQKQQEPAPEQKPAVEQHIGQGRLVTINEERGLLIIDHSDIPDFMSAMTMPFEVANPELLTVAQIGDSIHFTITKTDSGYFVTEVRVIK